MAEMIEMLPFGIWTPVGPRNYVLDGVQILPCEGVIFRGKISPFVKYRDFAVNRAKITVLIQIQFGILSRVGADNHVLDGGARWRRLVNTVELSMCSGNVALRLITLYMLMLFLLLSRPLL